MGQCGAGKRAAARVPGLPTKWIHQVTSAMGSTEAVDTQKRNCAQVVFVALLAALTFGLRIPVFVALLAALSGGFVPPVGLWRSLLPCLFSATLGEVGGCGATVLPTFLSAGIMADKKRLYPLYQNDEEEGWSSESDNQTQMAPEDFEPRQERYLVQRWFLADVKNKLGVGDPWVDAFADNEIHVVDHYWGPGSPWCGDAFARHWSGYSQVDWNDDRRPLLWINPPFSMFDSVVQKIVTDNAWAVVICPFWGDKMWFKQLMKYAYRRYYYKAGRHIFENTGPTRWGVWALLVDGANPMERFHAPEDEESVVKTSSKSAQRRRRRKFETEEIC